VDTEVMMGQLAARGHLLTSRPEDADVIVVNTCGFIRPAQEESVAAILEMVRHKAAGRARRLIVAGCLVERFREQIRRELPEVDALVGVNDIGRVVEICEGGEASGNARGPYLYTHLTPRRLATPPHYAYLKIAEGCDHTCSFCIIPQLRGAYRSRPLDSIVAEAEQLFAQGVREINLVAQDTTSYGEDLGLRDGLARLLDRLARVKTPRPAWIRCLYAHPHKITVRLLETLVAHPALVRYLDLPLQHASGRLLRRMRRGGSGRIYLRLIDKIRRAVPGIALRTSLLAGFPGEKSEDFEDLCRFVQAARFDHLGVFAYSDEETSASFRLEGKLSRRTIQSRERRLMGLQRRISRALNRRRVGREVPVLVEGPSRETDLLWEARAPWQAPEIDGVCLINDVEGAPPRPGEMRRLRVTAAHDYDLVGTLLEEEPDGGPAR
jgi:ribosomal protein S12 methylthiotransferase